MDERTIGALTMVDGEDAYQATKTRKTYGRLWDLPHPQILLLGTTSAFWEPIFYRGDEKRSTSLLLKHQQMIVIVVLVWLPGFTWQLKLQKGNRRKCTMLALIAAVIDISYS